MDASGAGKVVALTNQIQTIQQALEIIDAGGKITAMTLQAPTPEPPPAPPPEPEPLETEAESDEPTTPTTPDVEPAEPQQVDAPALTISTEDLEYPPQMLQSIREQEVQMWQTAYDALAALGVTNVPRPPTTAEPLPATVAPQPTGPAPPSTRPTPPRQPQRAEPPPPPPRGRGPFRRS